MMYIKLVFCFVLEFWEIVNLCCLILNFINILSDFELFNM